MGVPQLQIPGARLRALVSGTFYLAIAVREARIWIVWLALAFAVGIFLGTEGEIVLGDSLPLFFVLGFLVLNYAGRYAYCTHSPAVDFGLFFVFMLFLGVLRGEAVYRYEQQPLPQDTELATVARITGEVRQTSWYRIAPVSLCACYEAGSWKRYTCKGILRFRNTDTLAAKLRSGDSILCRVSFASVHGGNPNAFDFEAFQRRGVNLFSSDAVAHTLQILGHDSVGLSPFARIRERIIAGYRAAGLSGDTLELVKTMSIGQRESLSSEIRTNFTKAGIAHILALSGLHVGFVYAILAFFSRVFFEDRRVLRFLRYFVPLLGVWIFVQIAGASASLLRAAIMLTAWGVSRYFSLRWHTVDVLAGAGIIILWLSPSSLFDLGFQLSFSAVLGIVLGYPLFRGLVSSSNRILGWVLKLLVVSFCAQLATLPIVLWRFGTLPLLALLTNIIAIPLAAFLAPLSLVVGLLPIGCSLSNLLGGLLGILASWLLYLSEQIAALSLVSLSGLRISGVLALLLGSALLFGGTYTLYRRRWVIFASLSFLGLFAIGVCVQNYKQRHSSEMLVYQQNYGIALSFREGSSIRGIYAFDSVRAQQNIACYAESIWGSEVVYNDFDTSPLVQKTTYGYCIEWQQKRIALPLTQPTEQERIAEPVDILLLTRGTRADVVELLQRFCVAEVVVLDATYPKWLRSDALQTLKQAGVEVYDIREKGAYCYEP